MDKLTPRWAFVLVWFWLTLILATSCFGLLFGGASQRQIAAQSQPDAQTQTEQIPKLKSPDERLADYTLWLTILTGVVGIGTIGLGAFNYLLWRETREGGKTARRLARATKASADAAATALTHLAATSNLERPWLFVEMQPHLQWDRDEEAGREDVLAILNIANYGRAPATIIECHIAFEDAETEPGMGLLRDEFHGPIGPGKVRDKLPFYAPSGYDWGAVIDIVTGDSSPSPERVSGQNFFFNIRIVYTEVNDVRHLTHNCWRWDHGVSFWVEFGGSEYNKKT